MSLTPQHTLDNPIWNALRTGNSSFALGDQFALIIRRDMGAFAGLPDYRPESWTALYNAISPAAVVVLFIPADIEIPTSWKIQLRRVLLQMVHNGEPSTTNTNTSIVPLLEEHIPQMLALTELTKPGPFLQRTIDFGNYEGIFENEMLVSMAGQRLQPLPYTEVSAVCTHPNALGKGYARTLIQSQINKITAMGHIPMLHVYPENTGAVRLYSNLGFTVRKELMVCVLEKIEV